MPIKKIRAAASSFSSVFDVNGDGVIDHRDAVAAAKIAGSAAAGVGGTVLISAAAGSTLVATGASALAAKVTMVAGAAAGAFIAVTLGSATTAAFGVMQVGSTLFISSASMTTAVSAKLAAVAAGGGTVIAQALNGTIAGFPIIGQIALSEAVSSGSVVIVGGIPMGVTAAVAAGLIAIVIVGGYAYYVLTKDRINGAEESSFVPVAT